MTTKGSKGTGLGLPVVAGILRKNGGALWFDSEPGRGTTVTVAWPMSLHEDADRTSVASNADPFDVRLDGTSILIVDDIRSVALVLSEMLQRAGAETTMLLDPDEAIALVTADPDRFNVIVTDIQMPGSCGFSLARAAAQLDPPVPCVAVTALIDRALEADGLFSEVLEKPVDAETLVRAVWAAQQWRTDAAPL